MIRKTVDPSLTWRILCCLAVLFICSCSSEKSETAKAGGPAGGSITAKPAESPGPSESVSLSPVKDQEVERALEALSKNNPKIDKAALRLETIGGVDRLKVITEGSDKNGNAVSFKFQWTKNGEPAGAGETISGFKRGDKISVTITPSDDQGQGLARSLSTEIKNTPPKITEHQQVKFDGKVWSYQVKATDADGDPLMYSLKTAPQGMTINPTTGFMKWEVPPEFAGKAPVTVSVTDGQGGEATYSFDVAIIAEAPKRK
jgi:hypothetical protein